MNDVLIPTGRGARRFAALFNPSCFSKLALALAAAACLGTQTSEAVPYASGISNNAGTISFVLNEDAGNVTVVFDGGATSSDLGALTKGSHSFSLNTATSFQIVVKKNAPYAWTQISTDSTPLRFFSARGVAVNLDPRTPLFGRVYVANAVAGNTSVGARATGDGIYVLNPDLTDALGQGDTALTAGLNFTIPLATAPALQNGNTPWRIEIGQDNHLYIADFSTNLGTIYRTDPDVSTSEIVLAGRGSSSSDSLPTIHTTIGGSPIARGSLETGDLTIWAIDGAMTGNLNRLMRWDIGAGPLPSSVVPVQVAQPSPLLGANANVTTDNDLAPDGKFFVMQNRSGGAEVGVAVLATNETGGGSTTLFNSLVESRSISNNATATDILRVSRAIKVSPDGKKLAVIRDDNQTWIIPLTNGIPNLPRRELVATFPATPTLGRDVSWDAAGNLYAISSGSELLRVWSPGGETTATTGSDGSFTVDTVQLPEVSVALTDDFASESGPDTATLVFTRTEPLAATLTVNYSLTGTAINGTDYETNMLSVTFGAGEATATVVITPIDDTEAEAGETINLTIASGTAYIVGFPSTASTGIADNELDVVTITTVDGTAYERFNNDTMTFRATRLGETNSELFVIYDTIAGTASAGDFAGANGEALPPVLYFTAGQVSQTLTIAPVDDIETEGNETVGVVIIAGADPYTPGTPDTAFGTIVDNELPPALVLFGDDLDNDTSANWTTLFGANNGIYDADVRWAFDYSTIGIPAAPNSTSGSTKGLFLQVNKTNSTVTGTAAVNLYPSGRTFSGNFAVRADMYQSYDITPAGSTEHSLIGLNHSGLLTNRATITTDNTANNPRGGDGVWAAIGTDASNSRDWSAYIATNANTLPGLYTNRSAASVATLLSAPPYALAGSPGNRPTSGSKTWAEVELSQNNNVITLKVNNNVVYSFPNPSGFTSGNIMIGHNDQADSIGSTNNFVIFDNIRVITTETRITSVTILPGNQVQIDFTSPGSESEFRLDSSSDLTGGVWNEVPGAVISTTAEGFRFVAPSSGDTRFYQIRR